MDFSSAQGTFEDGILHVKNFEEGEQKVTITINVGTQSITYDVAQLDIIHCQQHTKFPNVKDYIAQVGSEINELNYGAASEDEEDHEEDCVIGEHSVKGLAEGMTMDKNGLIKFSPTKSIPRTTITISVTVGHQTIEADPFEFEIVDCAEAVKFPAIENVFIQVDSEIAL